MNPPKEMRLSMKGESLVSILLLENLNPVQNREAVIAILKPPKPKRGTKW
jgi:hypothetical protein